MVTSGYNSLNLKYTYFFQGERIYFLEIVQAPLLPQPVTVTPNFLSCTGGGVV